MIGRLGIALLAAAVSASAAVAAAGDPEKRAINPADQAWAKRINLSHRDLPAAFIQGPRPTVKCDHADVWKLQARPLCLHDHRAGGVALLYALRRHLDLLGR